MVDQRKQALHARRQEGLVLDSHDRSAFHGDETLARFSRYQVKTKKNPAALPRLPFQPLTERKSVQILHLGPYAAEGPAIAKLHWHAQERGYSFSGKHHEIYLNAPDRTAPEKLKTIIPQPVL